MKTAAEALKWLASQRVVLLAAKVEGVPSLAHEIVQGPIKGSWWGHPMGKLIFTIASALEDSDDVLPCKLVEGKATFVHRAVWPSLARVLLDEGWRAGRLAQCSAAARKLYGRVEAEGEVRGKLDAKAVKALEEAQLALVVSEHTEKGHHEKVLTSWSRWAKRAEVKPAKGSLEAAIAAVREAAHGLEVL
jgi:hypothetical protein